MNIRSIPFNQGRIASFFVWGTKVVINTEDFVAALHPLLTHTHTQRHVPASLDRPISTQTSALGLIGQSKAKGRGHHHLSRIKGRLKWRPP